VAGTTLPVSGLEAGLGQAPEQIVGIEGSEFGPPLHACGAEHTGIDVGPQQDVGVAAEGGEMTDAVRACALVEPGVVGAIAGHQGHRQIGLQALRHPDRTRAPGRPPP